jgi:NADH-quinone oxidoreductase subunit G
MAPSHPGGDPKIWSGIGAEGPLEGASPLASPIADFYLTNPIARASETMAECSRVFVSGASKMAAE